MTEIRRLEDQFEQPTVDRLRKLQDDLSSLYFKGGAGRYYAKELIYTIEAGLLLASLHMVSSLLELFVRDLLIYNTANHSYDGSNEKDSVIEKRLEDDNNPMWTLSKMVDELYRQKVIKRADAENLKEFYSQVRIPIYHGLTRRFVRIHDEFESSDDPESVFDMFTFGRRLRTYTLEEQLEEKSITLLEDAISFMLAYSHYFEGGQ